jgi:hypothetical protein
MQIFKSTYIYICIYIFIYIYLLLSYLHTCIGEKSIDGSSEYEDEEAVLAAFVCLRDMVASCGIAQIVSDTRFLDEVYIYVYMCMYIHKYICVCTYIYLHVDILIYA